LTEFRRVRQQFEDAIRHRSINGVLAFVDSETSILVGDSGERGRRAFRKGWQLDDPKSDFWEWTLVLLRNGSVVSGCASGEVGPCRVDVPYWSSLPLDVIEEAVITGASVPAFRRADAASGEVARLSYEIVRLMDDSVGQSTPRQKWIHIVLPNGGAGFVRGSQIFRGADPSLTFIRRKNRTWRVAGYGFPYL
jgi:hypothetical protein